MNDITALMQKIKAAAITVARDGRTDDEWFYYLQCVHHKNVLALVEALEKAQKSNDFLKGQLSELANFNPDWDKLEASYESWREIAAELLVAKNRIVELESRTVTVKLPDPLMPAQHNSGELFMTPDNVIHGGYLNRDDVLRILAAAGIQVIEGEQKNG